MISVKKLTDVYLRDVQKGAMTFQGTCERIHEKGLRAKVVREGSNKDNEKTAQGFLYP